MKKYFSIAILAAGLSLFAVDYNINGIFAVDKEENAKMPFDWLQNKGAFLQPLGTVEVISSEKAECNGIKLASVDKPTHFFSLTRINVEAGDEISLKANVKGSGNCFIGYYCRNAQGGFICTKEKKFPASPDKYTEIEFKDIAQDSNNEKIGKINVYIASDSRASVVFENVKIEIKKQKK